MFPPVGQLQAFDYIGNYMMDNFLNIYHQLKAFIMVIVVLLFNLSMLKRMNEKESFGKR